jgi:hypothetical protein
MKFDSFIRLGVWALVIGILVYFGWFAPHGPEFIQDPIYPTHYRNVDDFYWQVHPFKFWDALGLLLFAAATAAISGAYKIVTGELYASKGEAAGFYIGAAVAGIAGVLFFYA